MMHLGKRPRPQRGNSFMRRTTSMTSLDLEEKEFQQQEPQQKNGGVQVSGDVFRPWMIANFPGVILPEPAHFLQACFRCKDRLRPGKDIYMYRGDAAFCSLECRNEQIYLDERLAKFMAAARQKKQTPAANGGGSANPRQLQQSTADGNENTLAAT